MKHIKIRVFKNTNIIKKQNKKQKHFYKILINIKSDKTKLILKFNCFALKLSKFYAFFLCALGGQSPCPAVRIIVVRPL